MKYLTLIAAIITTPAFAETTFQAEDQTPTGKFTTAGEVKQILELTKASWVGVREYEGRDLVYFSQVLSWRCGLHQIRYSVNGGEMQIWDMPDCQLDMTTPNAIPNDQVMKIWKPYELKSVQTIDVELLLDDMNEMSASFERGAIMIP